MKKILVEKRKTKKESKKERIKRNEQMKESKKKRIYTCTVNVSKLLDCNNNKWMNLLTNHSWDSAVLWCKLLYKHCIIIEFILKVKLFQLWCCAVGRERGTHMVVQTLISMKKTAERSCRMIMLHFRPTTCNKPMFRGITANKTSRHDCSSSTHIPQTSRCRSHFRNSRATSPRQLIRRVW